MTAHEGNVHPRNLLRRTHGDLVAIGLSLAFLRSHRSTAATPGLAAPPLGGSGRYQQSSAVDPASGKSPCSGPAFRALPLKVSSAEFNKQFSRGLPQGARESPKERGLIHFHYSAITK